jgi:hypothetical protein
VGHWTVMDVLEEKKVLAHTRIRTQDRPARSLVH